MEPGESHFIVGIDLGTSNCAVAFASLAHGQGARVEDFPIPQLRRLGEVAPMNLLPSALYLAGEEELPAEAFRLPWGDAPRTVVGEFARWQGSRVPGRLVISAKSWLCHPAVDRSAPILPWGAAADVQRTSPVKASALLLEHMRQAWDFNHPYAPLAAQEVVITVPASFDEAARSLTVAAAKQAGLEKLILLEEPQAAFYDFTAHHRRDLAAALADVRLVLVVDVGGGTTDFTLIQVAVTPEGPALRRLAVGDHLMLGGDNMDAALSRQVEEKILAGGKKLSTSQWNQLIQACRNAKEALLTVGGPEHYNLSVVAEGSRLVGGSISAQIGRGQVEQTILEGFLPRSGLGDLPQRSARTGLQELGLPYAQEPAITRHLAAFLRQHAQAGFVALEEETPPPDAVPRPDAILLNGGVFNSSKIAERLVEAVSGWWPAAAPIRLLRHDSLELAVARGAAHYGLVRRGMGRRISGGAARALFVGLEKAGSSDSIALCVIPRGQEEGEAIELSDRTFVLTLGRPVQFPLYSSTADRLEAPGVTVPVTEDMQPLPPIHTLLTSPTGKAGSVPVHLRALLTEIGTLELWCVANGGRQRWRLEFELRGMATQEGLTVTEAMPASFVEAREWIERVFGSKPPPQKAGPALKGLPPRDVKQLWASLERTLGPRESWRVSILRELWSVLFAGAAKRRRSSDHERVFFQLAGFTLRPGFGYPLDEWRCEQMAQLFSQGVEFHKEKVGWTEFWIMWRRLAGGLSAIRQQEVWQYLRPHLEQRLPAVPPKNLPKPKGIQPEGLNEMVRLAAALEQIESSQKELLGDWVAGRLRNPSTAAGPWAWTLGRVGARVPIYGSAHKVVGPAKAEQWVTLLLEPAVIKMEGALFALAQITRMTGDRSRDLDDSIRGEVLAALSINRVPESWQRMVAEVVTLEASDQVRALADTLPVGLMLK
jgi:hypothetical protein